MKNSNLIKSRVNEEKSTRQAFGEALLELGEDNPDVVAVCADLSESTKVSAFAKRFPKRYIEVGVAEQNMAGIAAGLALGGKIPFMASFGVFSPGRNWDQIRLSICYNNANVKIVSTHTGLSPSKDGATHEALEDIGILRVLPNMTIISPCDFYETKKAVRAAAEIDGPVYIRLGREKTPVITSPQSEFSVGKPLVLEEGVRVALIGTGTIISQGLLAAREINEKYKDSVKVINISTLKPFNEKTGKKILLDEIKNINRIVTLEEHQIIGGLGSLISETLSEECPRKITRLGMPNCFGESGDYDDLLKKYKLNREEIKKVLMDKIKEC